MNTRIFEIIQGLNGRAGLVWEEADKQDLAETVAKEICDMINSHTQHNNANDCLLVLKIKEHFGIKVQQGWVCSKCGTDRTKAACPKGPTAAVTGDCPMVGVAQ